ncbi:hypothetical protein [Streptomyces sp. CNQ085]|uniref:hypothetical protein n=1 Tax=Streptomyces sp. CNQ085 TaxID=2886944 RepID=UPI001F5080DE|nr:hypothetical protein [Streptomyces sp. CNQ085]MCI0384311.1 hypothetical protein [Streptomyces sp. CNQ085]
MTEQQPPSPGPDPREPGSDGLERALHTGRAFVLADLAACGITEAEVVSLVEEAVSHRRWWVGQWPEGAPFVPGLIAQDVQDALLDRRGRWPGCPLCGGEEEHALDVEPELGPDPHWVCGRTATAVAPVGELGSAR